MQSANRNFFTRKKMALIGLAAATTAAGALHAKTTPDKVFKNLSQGPVQTALEQNQQKNQRNEMTPHEFAAELFLDRLVNNGLGKRYSASKLKLTAKAQANALRTHLLDTGRDFSINEIENLRSSDAFALEIANLERQYLGASVLPQHTEVFFGEGSRRSKNRRMAELAVQSFNNSGWRQETSILSRYNFDAREMFAEVDDPSLQDTPEQMTTPASEEVADTISKDQPEQTAKNPWFFWTLAGATLASAAYAVSKRKEAWRNSMAQTVSGWHQSKFFSLQMPTFQAWSQRAQSALSNLRAPKATIASTQAAVAQVYYPVPDQSKKAVTNSTTSTTSAPATTTASSTLPKSTIFTPYNPQQPAAPTTNPNSSSPVSLTLNPNPTDPVEYSSTSFSNYHEDSLTNKKINYQLLRQIKEILPADEYAELTGLLKAAYQAGDADGVSALLAQAEQIRDEAEAQATQAKQQATQDTYNQAIQDHLDHESQVQARIVAKQQQALAGLRARQAQAAARPTVTPDALLLQNPQPAATLDDAKQVMASLGQGGRDTLKARVAPIGNSPLSPDPATKLNTLKSTLPIVTPDFSQDLQALHNDLANDPQAVYNAAGLSYPDDTQGSQSPVSTPAPNALKQPKLTRADYFAHLTPEQYEEKYRKLFAVMPQEPDPSSEYTYKLNFFTPDGTTYETRSGEKIDYPWLHQQYREAKELYIGDLGGEFCAFVSKLILSEVIDASPEDCELLTTDAYNFQHPGEWFFDGIPSTRERFAGPAQEARYRSDMIQAYDYKLQHTNEINKKIIDSIQLAYHKARDLGYTKTYELTGESIINLYTFLHDKKLEAIDRVKYIPGSTQVYMCGDIINDRNDSDAVILKLLKNIRTQANSAGQPDPFVITLSNHDLFILNSFYDHDDLKENFAYQSSLLPSVYGRPVSKQEYLGYLQTLKVYHYVPDRKLLMTHAIPALTTELSKNEIDSSQQRVLDKLIKTYSLSAQLPQTPIEMEHLVNKLNSMYSSWISMFYVESNVDKLFYKDFRLLSLLIDVRGRFDRPEDSYFAQVADLHLHGHDNGPGLDKDSIGPDSNRIIDLQKMNYLVT